MIINPNERFAILELERIKWFLGQLDLTTNDKVGEQIQDAYSCISDALKLIRKSK